MTLSKNPSFVWVPSDEYFKVANQTPFKNLITLDMGGTSTDVALIENGTPKIRRETKIADLVLKVPSIDVRTVGAGGGSIIQVPEVTKALRVGPESAGATPGPAAYGKGGHVATVTDANVVCGYLPEYLLGGKFKLDLDAARESVEKVANELGVATPEAAEGILKVVNETMYGALRLVSVEQGYDPRDFSLVAFGGAGPLHGCALGKLLGSWPVIVPPSPGVLCAWGDATASLRHETSTTFIRKFSETAVEQICSAFKELVDQTSETMQTQQGVPVHKQVFRYQADLRYIGQAITVPVLLDFQDFQKIGLPYARKLFEIEHEKLFSFKLNADVEVVNLRVVAEELELDLKVEEIGKANGSVPDAAIQMRTTLLHDGKVYDSTVFIRSALKRGHVLYGPCIITEMDSNTLILPGCRAEIDPIGNILIWEGGPSVSDTKDPDLKASKLEPKLTSVVTDIFENALRNARNEMDTLLTTVTMSPAIREQQDEFNVIAEPSGKMIVGQFGSFIGQLLRMWKGTIEPGDIFITNDPYSVGGSISHLNDYLVCLPIFVDDKLIAWAAQFGHHTDNGGSVPGSLPTSASQIFEEGIQIPVTKLASRGVWNSDMMELIYRNSRLPDWVRCDTQALVAACRLAAKRMTELYHRFGDKLYFEAIDELLSRNRKAVSSIFDKSIPENPVYYEDWIDDDGKGVGPWKIACTMTKDSGRLKFDFTGTDPQSSSSVNFYLSDNMWKMFVGIYLITVYDPNTVVNDGFHDLIDFHVPLGTILNPVRPAALSTRTHLLGRVMDLLCGLLGQKAPEFMTAGGFSDSPHFFFSGWRPDGSWFELYHIGFGGIPARPAGDGMDGHCLWPAMKSVPNEFLELYYPLRIEQYSTVVDSGGAGLYRGGNGQRIHYRVLDEGEISLHDDRWLSKPFGVLGGDPGGRSSKVLVRGSERKVLPSKVDHIKVSKGDLLEWITWGGGGWGDPLKRKPELVLLEVRRRLISTEGARRYGVIIKDLAIDLEATTELRREMAEARTASGLFNRGGSWDDLLKNCLAETGLPAPISPGEYPMRGPHTGLPHIREWMTRHGQILPLPFNTASSRTGKNGL